MHTVRWGLLSTAKINRRLMPAIRASKRGELVAVASRNLEKAQTYASHWEIPHAFGNYEAMLKSGAIDAVYISLPNHLHAEWSIRALQAGIHVLCEKPLALSVQEVDEMAAASVLAERVLAEAFMYRHHPQTLLVGEWVQSGRLGDIALVRATFNFKITSRDDIRLIPQYGGGSLWDVGVYPISFAQYIYTGPPEWVSGTQWVGDSGVDETFAGILEYSNGRMAQFGSCIRSPFHTFAEVIGTKGRLWLDAPFVGIQSGQSICFHTDDGRTEQIAVPDKELYLGEVEDMHAAILDGKPNYLSLQESRDHIRTVVALYASAHEKKVVFLT
jgi:xylose dehydrogenase (NAD/NADP)